jgi:hypothetical protein
MGHVVGVTVTEDRARELALNHLRNNKWEPVVTQVDDAVTSWRVHYNSRAYAETRSVEHALAGNLPLLIDKVTAGISSDASYLPRWKARVHVRLLTAAEGGRSAPISSGYRPSWRSARKPEWNDGAIQLDGIETLAPGREADGWLLPAQPHLWSGLIVQGDDLEAGEGSRIVGRAAVGIITLWHASDFR